MTALARHWDAVRDALADERSRKGSRLAVTETAFLPAALEIIEQPVSPTGRVTTWAMLGALAFTVGWLTLGHVDIVASAPGKLIPADNVKLVQPAEPGIVHAILVRDGERVRKGQVLVELDPTVSNADAVQAGKALETASLDAARLRGVLSALDGNGLVFSPPPGTPADVAGTQLALARAQIADIQSAAGTHRADGAVATATRAEAEIQAVKLTETIPLLDQQLEANERLLASGYVSKLKVIEMRRQRMAAARDRDAALATARRATAQIAVAGSSGSQSAAQARAEVLSDLAKAENDIRLKREELIKATQRSTLQRLVSPVDGTVAQLAVHTVGGVVEAAKPIMVVVPSGGRLVAEVKVLNRDAGFVHIGQPVAVKLDAFPFTRYGTLPGVIEALSSDAVDDDKLGLTYIARIALNRTTVAGRGEASSVTPGMSAVADIKTGSRAIGSYLLSPIDEARLSAGRER